MTNSNSTRRSFIKKSSYSAAAVTVLGTGVALGQNQSGCDGTCRGFVLDATFWKIYIHPVTGEYYRDGVCTCRHQVKYDGWQTYPENGQWSEDAITKMPKGDKHVGEHELHSPT